MTRYLWSPGVTGSQLAATELPGGVGSPVTTKLAHISSIASLTATTSCRGADERGVCRNV